jgi:hypothetical protein
MFSGKTLRHESHQSSDEHINRPLTEATVNYNKEKAKQVSFQPTLTGTAGYGLGDQSSIPVRSRYY